MRAHFLLGELRATPDARRALGRLPFDLLCRHAIGEHGLISPEEAQANQLGMQTLGEIVSRYWVDPTDPTRGTVLIRTVATWKSTTIELAGHLSTGRSVAVSGARPTSR
jgi:hypothetical protein